MRVHVQLSLQMQGGLLEVLERMDRTTVDLDRLHVHVSFASISFRASVLALAIAHRFYGATAHRQESKHGPGRRPGALQHHQTRLLPVQALPIITLALT